MAVLNGDQNIPPLRAEIKPANRAKLEVAGNDLGMSPNELVNVLLEHIDEIHIKTIVTIRAHDSAGRPRVVVRATQRGHRFG